MWDTNFPTQQQMNAFLHFISVAISALPRIALATALIIVSVCTLGALLVITLRLLDTRRRFSQKLVLLELTPSAFNDKTLLAMQQWFEVLHGMEETRSRLDKLLRRIITFSLEIVATREDGIRFVACIAERHLHTFERKLATLAEDIHFKQIEDYLPNREELLKSQLLEFRQAGRHFGYSLNIPTMLNQADPDSYLAGAMTGLGPDEMLVLQFVLSPTNVRHAEAVATRLLHNEESLHSLGRRRGASVGRLLKGSINSFSLGLVSTAGTVYHGPSTYNRYVRSSVVNHQQQVAHGIKPARTMGHIEQKLSDPTYAKLTLPHFRTNIRGLVITKDRQHATERADELRQAFGAFKTNYQSIKARSNFPYSLRTVYRSLMFKHRLPAVVHKNSAILATSELAALYHFPNAKSARVEDVVKSLSKTLPAPPIIKKRADKHEFDVMLGMNTHHGKMTSIGMLAKEREKHMYIMGSTGNGKTTLMEYAAVQDIRNGKGIAFIDPHGDSAKKILKYIPEERIKDVVYFNPIDIKHPIGLNMLELPTGLDEDELLLEKGRVTSAVVSVMRKVFSDDDASAHRIEAVMRNAVHTALTVEGATLFTVLKLLRNEKFRKDVVSKLEDENLKDFWQEEIGQAGEMQLVSITKGVTQRIDRFNISAPAKRMLSQSKSTISFEDIMDSGKILICNLGDLEEDETALFGTTILAKLKMAAERRARMPEHERKPFYVYVDEFQNFATTPFVKMLSSSRKYKLFLTIAEQSTKQQEDDRLTEAILSNVATAVCFRTGSHDDEELMLHRFDPFLTKGDISNLPTYNFYIRIQAEESLEPMSGRTIVLPQNEASTEIAEAVVRASRSTYAIDYAKQAKTDKQEEELGKSDKKKRNKGTDPKKGNDALKNNDDS